MKQLCAKKSQSNRFLWPIQLSLLKTCHSYSIGDDRPLSKLGTIRSKKFLPSPGAAPLFIGTKVYGWGSLALGFFPRRKERPKNMTDAMEAYIASQNIAHFKAHLREETHPDKRKILLLLLANEVAKHREAVQRAADHHDT